MLARHNNWKEVKVTYKSLLNTNVFDDTVISVFVVISILSFIFLQRKTAQSEMNTRMARLLTTMTSVSELPMSNM